MQKITFCEIQKVLGHNLVNFNKYIYLHTQAPSQH